MMKTTSSRADGDGTDAAHPLGAPTNRPKPADPEGQWIADDPSRPHIQRNTRTGMMRNIKPAPPPANPWFPYYFPTP